MNLDTIALFALTEFLLSLTPGPAVLLVMSISMRAGFRIGFMATLGILTTNALFFTLSALGVGTVILASAELFVVLKWVGAAYLAYLGLKMIVPFTGSLWPRQPRDHRGAAVAFDLNQLQEATLAYRDMPTRAFWHGFSLQASNPKNLAFFVAILPQFISDDGSIALQLVILGVVSVLLELPILVVYGAGFALSSKVMRPWFVAFIEALGGVVLIGLGAALATSERG